VFRAENSNTRRHLCEFTGLDFEMPITSHYLEAVRVGHRTFKAIFEGLERDFSKELAAVRDQYPSEPVVVSEEPVVIHFADAIAMLRDSGVDVADDYGDLSGADELALGALVKERRGVDFFVVDRYPAAIRPFYTMRDPSDDRLSNSYDFFLRGQEICSGAQRVHDPAMLEAALKAKGIDPGAEDLSPSLKSYMTAFEHGAPPHAGCGFGLERVVFLYLGLDNIRKASLFPRDPKRCAP
jgi:aspartyl-tRNA synthetase